MTDDNISVKNIQGRNRRSVWFFAIIPVQLVILYIDGWRAQFINQGASVQNIVLLCFTAIFILFIVWLWFLLLSATAKVFPKNNAVVILGLWLVFVSGKLFGFARYVRGLGPK